MREIYRKWWDNGNKVFQIVNYRKGWKEVGNKPHISFHTNGAKKSNGDKCLDVSITIGYIEFNYCNFNLQGNKRRIK